MRRHFRTVVLLLVAIVVIGAAPAAAGSSHSFKATWEGPTFPPITDPDILAARCPAGFEWIFGGFGTGMMTSPVYSGPFTYENDHCSRWVTFDPERGTGRLVGKAAAGINTITTPVGELTLEYTGTWVLEGDVATLDFTANVNMRYTIVGGTGVFEGASGHGRNFASGGIYVGGHTYGSLIPG